MQAMIIAAGLGTRLQPMTYECPKPLVQCGPCRLIEYKLHALVAAGVTEIVINISYHGWLFRQALGDGSRYGCTITYIEEPHRQPFGAVGGIVNALPWLQSQFVVTSADTVSDLSIPAVLNRWQQGDLDALLTTVPNPPHHPQGDFTVVDDRIVVQSVDSAGEVVTYAGFGVFKSDWFYRYRQVDSLRNLVLQGCSAGMQAGIVRHQGYWCNVDTPERWQQANAWLTMHGDQLLASYMKFPNSDLDLP